MIFIMRGTSCSGKDTFIKRHFEDPKSSNHVISSDNFREMLYGSFDFERDSKDLFKIIHQVIDFRLRSKVTWTVLNAANLKMSNVNKVLDLCKKYRVQYVFISIEPPDVDVLMSRSEERAEQGGVFLSREVLEKHHKDYFNCREYFIDEAKNSSLCSFIEINQNDEVLHHVGA